VTGADVAALILAAGSSNRFGRDKRRALGPWQGPLLHHVLALYRPIFADLAVVTGADDAFGIEACRLFEARLVVNSRAWRGIGSSLAVGMGWLIEGGFAGVVVGLADMPWIAPATIVEVKQALSRDLRPVAPVWQGESGFPRGIPAAHFDRLRSLDGDHGAGALLDWHPLPCDDPGVRRDVDRPEDVGEMS